MPSKTPTACPEKSRGCQSDLNEESAPQNGRQEELLNKLLKASMVAL